MLLSQFMNAGNLTSGSRQRPALAARKLDEAATALEARVALLRDEAERVRRVSPNLVGAEYSKVSTLQGVQSLTEAAHEIQSHADHLAASAYSPSLGVSSRTIASALGVSVNTAIKRIREASKETRLD